MLQDIPLRSWPFLDIQALKFLGRAQRQESIQDKEYLRVQENKVYMSQEYLF